MKIKKSVTLIFLAVFGMLALSGCQKNEKAELETGSKKIGYIRNFDSENKSFKFDEIEWITLEDTEKIKELNINPDRDMPNGFYINNAEPDTENYKVTDKTEYQIIDWDNSGEAAAVDLNGFTDHLNGYTDYTPLFWIDIDDNTALSITEQYVP
ncbi:MAG: hypothetical protein VB120_04905 [Lachnospiraceae bacterium]|nr:hypothetical protein [Lachnospiraceae bacterium]